jgi:mRNA interferase MazF
VGIFTAGAVVLVRFPFSDLSQAKLRPAVVLAECGRGDWLLCQITSVPYSDPRALKLTPQDFRQGSLRAISYARPAKLFTAHETLISNQIGILQNSSFTLVVDAVVHLVKPIT